jgi:beta-mannosidase
VASWASIDYFGNWKALQFMARGFNSPLLISAVEDLETSAVALHVTSDRLQDCAGTVNWWLVRGDGSPVADGSLDVQAPASANTLVETLQLAQYVQAHGPHDLILGIELVVDGKVASSNLVTFARPKHLELQDPGFSVDVSEAGDGAFQVTVCVQRPALWAWLELPERVARYSDNFVHVFPGKPVTITVRPADEMSLDEFKCGLVARSLVDTAGLV